MKIPRGRKLRPVFSYRQVQDSSMADSPLRWKKDGKWYGTGDRKHDPRLSRDNHRLTTEELRDYNERAQKFSWAAKVAERTGVRRPGSGDDGFGSHKVAFRQRVNRAFSRYEAHGYEQTPTLDRLANPNDRRGQHLVVYQRPIERIPAVQAALVATPPTVVGGAAYIHHKRKVSKSAFGVEHGISKLEHKREGVR